MCVYVCDAVWYGAVVIVIVVAVLCSGVWLLSLCRRNDDLVGRLRLGLCRRLCLRLGNCLGNGCGLQQRLLLLLLLLLRLQLQLFGCQGERGVG